MYAFWQIRMLNSLTSFMTIWKNQKPDFNFFYSGLKKKQIYLKTVIFLLMDNKKAIRDPYRDIFSKNKRTHTRLGH